MFKNLYVFMVLYGRGGEDVTRTCLDYNSTLAFMERLVPMSEDDRCNYLDEEYESIDSSDTEAAAKFDIAAKLVDTDFMDVDLNERLEKLRKGERFGVELEEFRIGFGTTKEDAKLAYAELGEEDLNDWGDEDEDE